MQHTPSRTQADQGWRPILSAAERGAGRHLPLPLAASTEERRAHARIPLHVAATVRGEGRTQTVATQDVSISGVCISTDVPLTVGSEVDVDVALPIRQEPVRVRGQVRWSRKGKAGIVFRSGGLAAVAAFVGSMLLAPTAEAAKTSVPTFDPNADVVLDMKAGGERPDEFSLTQAFEQQYSSFDECVADAKKNPNQTLPGDVDVEVLLNPKGHEPLGINAKLPAEVDKKSLRECLRGAVAAADYPSYDGVPVVVTFSFELDPGTYWEEE
ncbi:MAG: PilZ domain-containing protein [Nannocystaceae bacterium]|nr:PilZ domain-containing protein [bacterium]